MKEVISFDPAFSSHYCGTYYVDVAKTVTPGNAPGFHDAICYRKGEDKTVLSMEVFHCTHEEEKSQTLKARDYKDPQVVSYGLDRAAYNQGANAQYNFSVEKENIATQTSRGPGAVMKGEDMESVVRRITPKEAERLQGFPDGWTDIGEWTDSNGKKHQTTDSARYKALGNSIAVGYANEQSGFWMLLMKRISAQYERRATLGSLFDGIGGFPLAWETYNGKGSALWASEIEEFPIAVTKRHFPEEVEVCD